MNDYEEDALRLQLRGLRRDIGPQADLWPSIEQRIAQAPRESSRARGRGVRRLLPWALAASFLLALGFTWRMNLAPEPQPLIRQHAMVMAQDYRSALQQLDQAPIHPEIKPALDDLDHSAAQILSALDDHPEARFLLDQLRRTYARRLELTQRAVIT